MLKGNISYSLVVLLLISFAFSPLAQQAFAVNGTISDPTSCVTIVGGTWIAPNICQVNSSFSVNNGETLTVTGLLVINTGVTLIIEDGAIVVLSGNNFDDGIFNFGTIEQSGLVNFTGSAGVFENLGIWTLFCGEINGGPNQGGNEIPQDCNKEIIFPLTEITADIHISNVVVNGSAIDDPGSVPIVIENDLLISDGAILTNPFYIQNFAFITLDDGYIDTTSGSIETICANSPFRGSGGSGLISPTDIVDINCNPPTGASDSGYTTAEDTPSLPIDVLSNDSPGSNPTIPRNDETLSVYAVTPGTNGFITTDGNTVTYTPNPNFNGLDSFTYTLKDGNDVFSLLETSVSITVTPVPDPPILDTIGPQSIDEGVELTFIATASSVDVPPNTLVFSLSDGTGLVPPGAAIQTTGEFSWTPSEGQTGVFTFDVVVSDGQGGTDFETITVTVTEGPNNPPVLNPIGSQSIDEGVELTFIATASDADVPPNTLVFSLSDGTGLVPPGAAIQTTGEFSWTPSEGQTGVFTFDVVVSDGQGDTDFETITITVSVVNQAPVLNLINNKLVEEETLLTFTATATDADLPANTFTFSLVDGTSGSIPAGAAIDPVTGVFTFTPSESQVGPFTFDVLVTDDGIPPLSDFETITVTVTEGPNNPPVLNPIGSQSIDEGVELTFIATASDADLPANTFTFSLVDGTSGSIPAGATIQTTGEFSWTPSEGQTGVFTFDVVVSDGQGGTDFETITVTVSAVNQAPILDTIGNQLADEGVELTFIATASDADLADTLVFSLSDGTGLVPAGAAIDGNTGAFSWTPSVGQTGVFTFDVVVTDDGIPSLSDFETITVTVAAVNVAPVCFEPTTSTPLIYQKNHKMVSFDYDMIATDANGDTITLSIYSIFQDEPTNDGGDGDKSPDADLTKSEIRAERSGSGDGRVYEITIMADDNNGGTCTGSFTIGISHDNKDIPVDSIVRYDSTVE